MLRVDWLDDAANTHLVTEIEDLLASSCEPHLIVDLPKFRADILYCERRVDIPDTPGVFCFSVCLCLCAYVSHDAMLYAVGASGVLR